MNANQSVDYRFIRDTVQETIVRNYLSSRVGMNRENSTCLV
jgi:hypothetical protein